MEEDKWGVPTVITIRAATPERLVQLCVNAFTETGAGDQEEFVKVFFLMHQWFTTSEELAQGDQEEFVKVFFLMHQWLTTSEELAQAFIDLYQGCEETVTCNDATRLHLPSCPEWPIQHLFVSLHNV